MAREYRPVDRGQEFLLPPAMTDWLPADHLVWFVIEAVRRLDTAAFHAKARLGGVGRRGYDPEMLLTLFVYAMAHGVRSSRQIERLCQTDVAFRIVCANDAPDHTVLARFRQRHEQALAGLLTETLVLAAELGFVRLGVVALDGTKIAANASREANRTESGLRKIAEKHLAETAATDAAEEVLFGAHTRGDELPDTLRDRTHRGRRIAQAQEVIAARKAAEAEAAEGERARGEVYLHRLCDPHATAYGRPPVAADPVEVSRLRWERERARAQARQDQWQAKADTAAATGHKLPGPPPAPVDAQAPVRRARAAYDAALAEATEHADQADQAGGHDTSGEQAPGGQTVGRDETPGGDQDRAIANLTDPGSRLLKTRNGWLQGYNCQTGVSDDQFIMHAEPTQDANDLGQYEPVINGIVGTADQLTARTGRDDLTVGTALADAGYNSEDNLTAAGPDRLIANGTRYTVNNRAVNDPAVGDPPADATARERMDHRLRTLDGHALYTRRSPLVETPNAWLKDRRGLRQFSRRGLDAVRSELRFGCAVTNLLRLHNLGITTTQLAT